MLEAQVYRVNEPKVVSETLDGETIVINLDTGSYFSLNATASIAWTFMIEGFTQPAIAVGLSQHFEVSEEDATTALQAFFARLVADRLIVASEAPGRADLPLAAAQQRLAFVAPAVERYDDMQELLLADPIHDVSAAGWPHLPRA